MKIQIYIYLILIVLAPAMLLSQTKKKVEVKHADELIGSNTGNKHQRLIGNVQFYHDGANMYCDSAIFYKDQNSLSAFGNIKLIQGDSVRLYGQLLEYNGNTKLAVVRKNVSLTDRKMTIYSEQIFFDRQQNIAYYLTEARIVDSANTLTSKKGYYYTKPKDLFFKEKVVLVNTDFNLFCDTLKYNVNNRIATFLSPTTIYGDDTEIYTEQGWYNTLTRKSEFRKNARIFNEGKKIYGDKLYFENENSYARAEGHVIFIDTNENSEIRGNFAEHFDHLNLTYVTDSAVFINYMDDDTLYLHADTLKVMKDSAGTDNILLAYNKVKGYSTNMQLRCDSLSYYGKDSTIRLYKEPILWNEKNQITAKDIYILIKDDEMDKMFLSGDCFMIEQIDGIRYNQIKGRNMVGYFKNSQLATIDVTGNAECIYYLTDDINKFIGMNKNKSSYIHIKLEDKKITNINFVKSPVGQVYTPKEMDGPESKFENFKFYKNERPKKIADIFNY